MGQCWSGLSCGTPLRHGAGISLDHGPPAAKFPECKMGTQKLWHKGVEMFMAKLDPATAANGWDLHEICIFSRHMRDKCLFLKICDCAKAGTQRSIPTCPATPPLLLAIFPPPFPREPLSSLFLPAEGSLKYCAGGTGSAPCGLAPDGTNADIK